MFIVLKTRTCVFNSYSHSFINFVSVHCPSFHKSKAKKVLTVFKIFLFNLHDKLKLKSRNWFKISDLHHLLCDFRKLDNCHDNISSKYKKFNFVSFSNSLKKIQLTYHKGNYRKYKTTNPWISALILALRCSCVNLCHHRELEKLHWCVGGDSNDLRHLIPWHLPLTSTLLYKATERNLFAFSFSQAPTAVKTGMKILLTDG